MGESPREFEPRRYHDLVKSFFETERNTAKRLAPYLQYKNHQIYFLPSYTTCEVSKDLFIQLFNCFGNNITIKLTPLMLSWPPGPCRTLNSIDWSVPLYIERKTYRRVGLNSVGVSGSQKFAKLAFPPGFSRTRLKENLINNLDGELKAHQRACWVLHLK